MCFLLSFSFPIFAMWFPHAVGFFQRFSALCELLLSLPAPEPRGAAAGASTGQFGRAKGDGTGLSWSRKAEAFPCGVGAELRAASVCMRDHGVCAEECLNLSAGEANPWTENFSVPLCCSCSDSLLPRHVLPRGTPWAAHASPLPGITP